VIKLHDDLVDIYRVIRDRYQSAIDQAFDDVSRQIGFVIMTTLPVTLKVEGTKVSSMLVGENLRGTLFEHTFGEVLGGFGVPEGGVADGSYSLYLIWYDALKLKLHTDWMEPAHVPGVERIDVSQRLRTDITEVVNLRPGFGPASASLPTGSTAAWRSVQRGPGHQRHRRGSPELRLVDRVKEARRVTAKAILVPGIREPAHFRQLLERSTSRR
jgi:hypothetical protein